MRVNIFFEGGGILGICYLGAYKALIDHGFKINQCIGISAGSLMSSLIIAGYTPDELIDIMATTDFSQFSSKTDLSNKTFVGKPMSLILNKGIYDSQVIEHWIDSLLQYKGVRTFEDVMWNGECLLHIIAADSTKKQALIIPSDLVQYGIDPKSFPIARAVRMSSAIPYYYTPVKLKGYNRVNNIVDGAMVKNIPTELINQRLHNFCTPTFRFKVKKYKKNKKRRQESHAKHYHYGGPMNEEITIYNDLNIKAIDFNINREQIRALYNIGYESTEAHLIKRYKTNNCYYMDD